MSGPPLMLLMVGLPGSGKSTFAQRLVQDSQGRHWTRINQVRTLFHTIATDVKSLALWLSKWLFKKKLALQC